MPQNISDATGYPTTYEVGVPLPSEFAEIINAFAAYHYGPNYTGSGAKAGMEKIIADIYAALVAHSLTPHSTDSSFTQTFFIGGM